MQSSSDSQSSKTFFQTLVAQTYHPFSQTMSNQGRGRSRGRGSAWNNSSSRRSPSRSPPRMPGSRMSFGPPSRGAPFGGRASLAPQVNYGPPVRGLPLAGRGSPPGSPRALAPAMQPMQASGAIRSYGLARFAHGGALRPQRPQRPPGSARHAVAQPFDDDDDDMEDPFGDDDEANPIAQHSSSSSSSSSSMGGPGDDFGPRLYIPRWRTRPQPQARHAGAQPFDDDDSDSDD